MDMENIKKVVKESIVQNFMEAAKFAPRGAEKQRPKSWSKGTKSGSDKRKMREEGKRDAQQINEEGHDEERDAVAMGYGSAAAARRDNWGHSPEQIKRAQEIARQQDQETETKRRSWSATNILPLLQKHGMEELAKKTDPNGMPTYAFAHPNSTAFYQDFIAAHTAGIQDNKENNHGEIGRTRFHQNAITDAQQRMDLDNRLNAKKMQQSTGDLSETYYNKLKENTEIPRHARETPEETPDYYGELEAQRAAGTSNEESPSVADRLTHAHENALSAALIQHGKGSKKPDEFELVKKYLENIERHHLRIMGDIS